LCTIVLVIVMMSGGMGECVWVRPRIASFRRAIERTVRPGEMLGLANQLDEIWECAPLAFANILGWWLVQARKSGRLVYIPDPDAPVDFWCSPRSTWKRGGGDCDDLAVFAASTLLAASRAATVVVGELFGVGHAWCEGYDDAGWFLLEATSGDVFRGSRPLGYEPYPTLG
jgi:hypothetical protein